MPVLRGRQIPFASPAAPSSIAPAQCWDRALAGLAIRHNVPRNARDALPLLAGPIFDEEILVTAELNLDALACVKIDFDVAGHYARPVIFSLTVNEASQPAVTLKAMGTT